jgi:hypothetical protein
LPAAAVPRWLSILRVPAQIIIRGLGPRGFTSATLALQTLGLTLWGASGSVSAEAAAAASPRSAR